MIKFTYYHNNAIPQSFLSSAVYKSNSEVPDKFIVCQISVFIEAVEAFSFKLVSIC